GVFTVNICTVTWTGSVSTDWFENNNWNPAAVPNVCAASVVIPSSAPNYPVISGADVSVGNVDIAAGVTLTLAGQNLNVCGNWTGGTSTHAAVVGSGTVYMNSTSIAQTINGNTKFEILQINNSRGVSLSAATTVSI